VAAGTEPGTDLKGIFAPMSFSRSLSSGRSLGVTKLVAFPLAASRAVRPMRWT
jgi:hypothetical protein